MADELLEKLFSLKDEEYRQFHSKLMPEIEKDRIIGIRVPILRKLAKELSWDEKKCFINELPHKFYEENNLHAFIIENIKDYEVCISEVERFLPFVDNWATCDSLRPKCFKANKKELLQRIEKWLLSNETYTVRFALEMLMVHFLDEDFEEKFLWKASRVESQEYYVNMMLSWYFATALAKRWSETIGYITEGKLSPWVNNKTIQKAVESYRITDEQKEFLKKYKR